MAQSKPEVATRNARIRAEKLRENLARRKQQSRQRAIESKTENEAGSGDCDANTDEKALG